MDALLVIGRVFTLRLLLLLLPALLPVCSALSYDPAFTDWNLNQNPLATHPAEYSGRWENHIYHPSPTNWRFPFYALNLDRFVDGDPTNNEANGTVFEHHWMTNQFRFGGDARGLQSDLDYLQGMGIKAVYLTGSPFINMPWSGDGYGPLDFTLLDAHHGTIADWRALITEIHRRDMYIILDNTMATMGDLIAMKGYVNASVPFSWQEYDYVWKSDRRYHDFHPGNAQNASCKYPGMWGQDGYPLTPDITIKQMNGCRVSEFDLYGDIKGTGAYPSWRNQLSKFASVQDRLREWNNDVFEKISVMSCIQIKMLDIDGFRMDKGLQTTPDAMAEFASDMRRCARSVGKDNFIVNGEVVGDPRLFAVYIGRGKQPNNALANLTQGVLQNEHTDPSTFIRPFGDSALDGTAFHYDVYGAMTRFLGLDGPWGKFGVDWVSWWNRSVREHDMVNANTGLYDPRHMMGMTNQDVFRWPALANGTQQQLLGWMVTMLEMPGIPLLLWGEEQGHYVLENLADDYVFGRTPMASSTAYQLHGCYRLSETVYVDIPFDSARHACYDDSVSRDHRDPSHPIRNVLKRMFELRDQYPVLNDGFYLRNLSSKIYDIFLPGSDGVPSPHGIWSVYRGRVEGVQDFSKQAGGNQGAWFVYHNEDRSIDYDFDCSSPNASLAMISPFPAGTTVKDLLYPYEERLLESSVLRLGIEKSGAPNGCLSNLTMRPWEYKVFVPAREWQTPRPTITRFLPGHDARLRSAVKFGQQETVPIQFRFSSEMSCDSVMKSLSIESSVHDGQQARLNRSSVVCTPADADPPRYVGEIATTWIFAADLENVSNGIHRITVANASTTDGKAFTNAVDRFNFRIGHDDNPIVFPTLANYTRNLLHKSATTGDLYITPRASGAEKFRYSLNWGSSFSQWYDYTGEPFTLAPQHWSGTKRQEWTGEHVIVHYWNAMTGSTDHVQHADLGPSNVVSRRWPHAFAEGPWNDYGYDSGVPNDMSQDANSEWVFAWTAEWPSSIIVNVWGMNPDGQPDKSSALGDVDGDGVLDWVPPNSLAMNVINVSAELPHWKLGYRLYVNDGTYRYRLEPGGSALAQMIIALLFAFVPLLTGWIGVQAFQSSFYQVKLNEIGLSEKPHSSTELLTATLHRIRNFRGLPVETATSTIGDQDFSATDAATGAVTFGKPRRTVLIGTLEYNIDDWQIKIKIGGLGVMSALMGKHLTYSSLIWVVPCLGGVEYPIDRVAEPMKPVLLEKTYKVDVQYHTVANITYVLLDAPIFRKRTKAEPYPPRMDDLESAVYYSVWNQCLAETIRRFPIDLYHINDYHGTIAPLYLLPETLPVCLSLHNAEFQGMWPLRTHSEMSEICQVFNLPKPVVQRYVQFGEVFNLLHAGASLLRENQKGFGAVGVSKKYGKRAHARYAIFWGLPSIGALPNPDPSDTAAWDKQISASQKVVIDEEMEAKRGDYRREAQEWAGLNVDPEAELFVFVGRWSQQKGVDLIADVFFSVLTKHPNTQLICVGPTIDLHGKFAALKLAKLVQRFPGRVYSKPEFTALPPCIFTGAEFALIPSRDEPFGLVAVEFGRKGALGVGSRVGGLGQMPGFWYTIESTTTQHNLNQFKEAIRKALTCPRETRALMRARSLVQRFPVAQWVEDLEILHSTSIKMHNRVQNRAKTYGLLGLSSPSIRSFNLNSTDSSATPKSSSRAPSTYAEVPRLSPPVLPLRDLIEIDLRPGFDTTPSSSSIYSIPTSDNASATPNPGQRSIGPSSIRNQDDYITRVSPEHLKVESMLAPGDFASHRSDLTVQRPCSPSPSNLTREAEGSGEVLKTMTMTNPNVRFRVSFPHDEAESVIPVNNTATETQQAGVRFNDPFSRPASEIAAQDGHVSQQSPSKPTGLMSNILTSLRAVAPWSSRTPLQRASMSGKSRRLSLVETFSRHRSSLAEAISRRRSSMGDALSRRLSLAAIVGKNRDFNLLKVEPPFTDSTNSFYNNFDRLLDNLDVHKSENELCIEKYLAKSEKKWFGEYHRVKIEGKASKAVSSTRPNTPCTDGNSEGDGKRLTAQTHEMTVSEEFNLDEDFVPARGLKRLLQKEIGDWQIYCFLLAFGQIMATNSYQITLLAGDNGESANKLYIVASIYFTSTLFWWYLYRRFPSIYVLTIPFALYGTTFFLMGMAPYTNSGVVRGWIYNVATGLYTVGAASGSFFFALNFGTEGGTATTIWTFRACVIQGTQQIYCSLLWYWGTALTRQTPTGHSSNTLSLRSAYLPTRPTITFITVPVALLLWATAALLYAGLPKYYRQQPGAVTSFYSSVLRRNVVRWFLFAIIMQNYFLSAQYGRTWRYLWSSAHAPAWAVALLTLLISGGVWAAVLAVLGRLSIQHSWLIPIFAVNLGAPRWAQVYWATSGIAAYVPFPWGASAGPVVGALLGRALWLWMGLLDAVQGVGVGMLLLQTLTRHHVLFALVAGQALGSVATLLARATAPDAVSPASMFPNLAFGFRGLANPWFWVGVVSQLVIVLGYVKFFRKEQMFKP